MSRRIFYDLKTGEAFFEIGRNLGMVNPSIEQDIMSYQTLSERNRNTFNVLELPFETYAQDFEESISYRVNLETKELEFSYPDPNEPEAPPMYIKPLTEQVAELEAQNMELMLAVAELSNANETDKIETQLAIAELASMVMEGVQ